MSTAAACSAGPADEELPTLGELGVACVVDLRDAFEIAAAPPVRLPGDPRVVHLPVYDPQHPLFCYVAAVVLGHDLEAFAALAQQGTPAAMAGIYRWFVSGEPARQGFAGAVRLAARASNLPMLFHCSAGKDRTGWLAVILLTALGVDEADIRADYLRTNDLTESVQEAALRRLRAHRPSADAESVRAVLQVHPDYLDAAYDEVNRVYGSFDRYLRDGLGLTGPMLRDLRGHLLE